MKMLLVFFMRFLSQFAPDNWLSNKFFTMLMREVFVFCFVFLVGFTDSAPKVAKLPKNLMRCSRKGPIEEVNECMRKAIEDGFRKLRKGDPSINVDQIEPLAAPDIQTEQSSGPINFKISQKNVRLTGLSAAKVKKIKFNWDKNAMSGEFYTPKIVQTADQTINGRILLFPITGTGKATYVTIGYRANFTGHFDEYEKNGYHYWKFDEKSFRFAISVDKMEFKFENLFNGDKRLGDAMNRILNENWRALASEIKPITEMIFGKLLLNALDRFFSKVPLEEIFLD